MPQAAILICLRTIFLLLTMHGGMFYSQPLSGQGRSLFPVDSSGGKLGGYIDTMGTLVVPFSLSRVSHFSEDRAWVRSNGINYLINSSLDTLATDSLDYEHGPFSGGVCVAFNYRGKGNFILDNQGRKIAPLPQQIVSLEEDRFIGGFACNFISKLDKPPCYFTNRRGETINSEPLYRTGHFSDGLCQAAKQGDNGLMGYIDSTGQFAIPCRFKLAGNFSEGAAPCLSLTICLS